MPRKWIKITTVVVAALVAAGIAYAAGTRSVDDEARRAASSGTTGPTTTSPTSPATEGLVEFRDDKDGFAVSYPGNWLRLQSGDPNVVLVVSEKPVEQNNGGSILVRTTTLSNPVGPDQLNEAKTVTDQIVTQGPSVELKFEPKVVNQGGLPGWLYFYTFADTASGQRGVHSHYFLFKDRTMISVVLQALPETEFARLAPIFDDVMATFRVL